MTKQKKEKVIETVVVTLQDFHSPEFEFPSRYCIRNAMGEYVFFKTSKRELAQQQADKDYGTGRYKIREV